jgi:FixJ family two-component response regulator
MVARGLTLPVVFLTAHGDLPTAVGSMKRGAVDFLAKPADEKVLVETLREAIARHAASLAQRRRREGVETRLAKLSKRQREVLSQVIAGRLNKQIADKMGISIKTVKVHRARVMERLEVDSIAALVHACESIGLTAEPSSH